MTTSLCVQVRRSACMTEAKLLRTCTVRRSAGLWHSTFARACTHTRTHTRAHTSTHTCRTATLWLGRHSRCSLQTCLPPSQRCCLCWRPRLFPLLAVHTGILASSSVCAQCMWCTRPHHVMRKMRWYVCARTPAHAATVPVPVHAHAAMIGARRESSKEQELQPQ